MGRLRAAAVLVFISLVTPQWVQAQSSGSSGSKGGLFEIGVLGGLILPSGVPDADEIYPTIGPHLALRTSYAVLECELFFGAANDDDNGAINHLVYLPFGLRFDFTDKGMPGYASIGAHAVYYMTHTATGATTYGADGGVNVGGGLLFEDSQPSWRLDLRIYARPGWTVSIGLIAFLNL